ncbi:MAG: RNA chaperone Hfq [Thermotogae bacterium]|nr:RNA chaperone Hfq [Thermotogota bacterium]
MMIKGTLQDKLLNTLRINKVEVKIYLVNGFQIRGIIRSFDNFTLLIENGKQQTLLYKHAISTLVPTAYIRFKEGKTPQKEEVNEKKEVKEGNEEE